MMLWKTYEQNFKTSAICSIIQGNILFLLRELLSEGEIMRFLAQTQFLIQYQIVASDKQTHTTQSAWPNLREN